MSTSVGYSFVEPLKLILSSLSPTVLPYVNDPAMPHALYLTFTLFFFTYFSTVSLFSFLHVLTLLDHV